MSRPGNPKGVELRMSGGVSVQEPILEVRNLVKHFPVGGGWFGGPPAVVKAVDGVSFTIHRGETLGLVGESGCGKTTTGRAILRLEPPTSGEVIFEGRDLATLSASELRAMRRRMQVIFQDPYSSLNPRMTVGQIIAEPLRVHGIVLNAVDPDSVVTQLRALATSSEAARAALPAAPLAALSEGR